VGPFFELYALPYLAGLGVGIGIATLAIAVGLALGLFGALAKLSSSRSLNVIGAGYTAIFRAIPPLLTLYIVYFGLPSWVRDAGIDAVSILLAPLNNRTVSAVVALSLTAGAYMTEIIRAAIISVGPDQMDAARSLGLRWSSAFRYIIAPQAARIAFPALASEYIVVIKGTSLLSVIGVVELMRTAQIAAGATLENMTAYSLAGLYYIALVFALQTIFSVVERKLDPGGLAQRGAGASTLAFLTGQRTKQ
jgi:His/Glu/Gln/Arg/opine family amino acid ABC transporter permease subunit